ncbi:hypothetical protein [Nocardia xishanensis]|uniref:hypothetical protein n=1 Tax=Nocardia xishanensis TaxID=238964 RepID=UPI0008309370|nr:hypothetical protein [Nocardia xishanensis]
MRQHRGASQWDFRIDGESDFAAKERRLRSQQLCGSCPAKAKTACAKIHADLVTEYSTSIPGIWAGRIWRDGDDSPKTPNVIPLYTHDDLAA